MRTSDISVEEVEKAEQAVADRVESRKRGFAKMHERDAGGARIRNYIGGEIIMYWPTVREPEDGEAMRVVPDNMFLLVVDGKEVLIDAEEFRKHLRWV